MKASKSFLSVFILFSFLFVLLCQEEVFARVGGGRSFGSRGSRPAAPSRSYSSPRPAQPPCSAFFFYPLLLLWHSFPGRAGWTQGARQETSSSCHSEGKQKCSFYQFGIVESPWKIRQRILYLEVPILKGVTPALREVLRRES